MGDFARHEDVQSVAATRIVAEFDQTLVYELGARFSRNI